MIHELFHAFDHLYQLLENNGMLWSEVDYIGGNTYNKMITIGLTLSLNSDIRYSLHVTHSFFMCLLCLVASCGIHWI